MVKKLPDTYSFRDWRSRRYFSAENTQSIAEKFGFPTDYSLANKLNDAAGTYDTFKKENVGRPPEGAEGKAFFKEMERRAAALAKCFDKLGWATDKFLDAAKAHGLDIDPSSFKWKLHRVADAARTAAQNVPDKGPGRDPDIALPDYIARLRKIYCEGTGKEDRRTYNTYAETDEEAYTGAFFNFVKACLSVVGITKSNAAVAKAIQQTLRLMDKSANPDAPTSANGYRARDLYD